MSHSIVGNAAALDPDGTPLAGIDCGKSCIRFKKTRMPDDTAFADLIQRLKSRHDAAEQIDC
jgi:hypothetical protein